MSIKPWPQILCGQLFTLNFQLANLLNGCKLRHLQARRRANWLLLVDENSGMNEQKGQFLIKY
ncbi:MAG: hypothetical protein V3V74_01170 [Nitrosomonadaceae bacterium]